MEDSSPVPISLKVVAGLFFLEGVIATVEVLLSLLRNNFNLNFGVLGLFICFGLLRYRRGWRTCALVFTWLGLIGLPILIVLLMVTPSIQSFNFFGNRIGNEARGIGIAYCIATFLVAIWQYRVLTKPEIRSLFYKQG